MTNNKQNNKQKVIVKTENTENYNPEDLIFALDIGTRTVVGIVGYYEKEIFKVIAAEVYEHKSRAMLDGQIHDITKVAEVVEEVKSRLENELGIGLTKVAIAAAGRVLKTSQIKLEYDIEQGGEISADIVGSLEVDAVQKAQENLDNEQSGEEKIPFYCVGYSVVNYFLNGYVISSLIGHKGKKIGVEVLATFLPHVVVDSLYTVMERVGLQVAGLTLEPIAAISVTIPKDLRLLNLVLVDIGAGTSDIAVTKDGTVIAYGMVPIAGDEITERIAQEFLVDFNTAEKIKISISSGTEVIKFTDILGKKKEVSNLHALEILQPTVDLLADSISGKIMEFNQKAPNAVFLIGGGSQIPGLSEKIAKGLGIADERVAVRGRDVIQNIKTKIRKLTGPESITPFGIAMMAYATKGQDFLSVTVNGEKIQLLNSKKLTVADAFILVGYNPDMLIGRTGKSLRFDLNGRQVSLKGGHGVAAEILVNGSPASLDTRITAGDHIDVSPAQNGSNAAAYVSDYIKNPEGLTLYLNDDMVRLAAEAALNGKAGAISAPINDGDDLKVSEVVTLSDFVSRYTLELKDSVLLVNDEARSLDYSLRDNDRITCYLKAGQAEEAPGEAKAEPAPEDKVTADVNSGNYNEYGKDNGNGNSGSGDVVGDNVSSNSNVSGNDNDNGFVITVNGGKIVLAEGRQYIFVDVFNYIDFDLTSPKGNIVLKLNGRNANFTDNILAGDSIEIYWEKFKA